MDREHSTAAWTAGDSDGGERGGNGCAVIAEGGRPGRGRAEIVDIIVGTGGLTRREALRKSQRAKKKALGTGHRASGQGTEADVIGELRGRPEILGNRQRVMTCGDPDDPGTALTPTNDPFDRAHSKKNWTDKDLYGDPRLMPAAAAPKGRPERAFIIVEEAKPRLYARSQLNSNGVSPDTAADHLHEAQLRLSGIPGVGFDPNRRTQSVMCERAAVVLGRNGLRSITSLERYEKNARRAGLERSEWSE